MLQVARLAPSVLEGAAGPLADFVRGEFNPDGGARDRAGKSDLYYTVFALECLIALRQEPPVETVGAYLERFGDGAGLDFVHLTCLARCWAALPKGSLDGERAGRIRGRVESFRSGDGGFSSTPGAPRGTVYHGFLALGAIQDLGGELRDPGALARSIAAHEAPDGSLSGTTPTTAGAVAALRNLGAPVPAGAGAWLYGRARPEGGFAATPEAPIPDLLSTATALHALAGLKVPLSPLKEACLDFVDTLWTGRAFCGSWADDVEDVEYTYYALLSLGHLSLP
jgi:hypothetical protein